MGFSKLQSVISAIAGEKSKVSHNNKKDKPKRANTY